MNPENEFECVLCNEQTHGYGNNPQPLANDGRCCDDCNMDVVMARVMINRVGRNMESNEK